MSRRWPLLTVATLLAAACSSEDSASIPPPDVAPDGGDAGVDVNPDASAPPDAATTDGGDAADAGCAVDCGTLPNVADPSKVSCVAGSCVVPDAACAPGFRHCSSDPLSGCESDLSKPATCGSCESACTGDKPLCDDAKTCQPDCGTKTNCGGTCADLATDALHCGACGKSCLGAACAGGLCAAEKASPAGCPWGVTVSGGTMYWTENAAGGCTGAIRSCANAGCATLPAAIAAASNYPMGIAVPPGASSIFYADNQNPGPLWKMDLDGGNRVDFSNAIQGNSGGVTANATHVFWVNRGEVFRTAIGTANGARVLGTDASASIGIGPNAIALDAARVFAAPGGGPLLSCTLAGDCSEAGAVVIANEPAVASQTGVGGVTSDGTHVFYTGGNDYGYSGGDKAERVVRCPVAGCTGGVPEVIWSRTTTSGYGQSTHFGIVTDAKNVYWGTIAGTIYFAPKGCAAPCTATPFVTGAKPFGMAIDGPYLYWADGRGGIYRAVRP